MSWDEAVNVRPPVAVGDIHGRLDLLDALIAAFPERRFVFLGDLTDRGPDSPGVIARVRELLDSHRAIVCMGNHDLMFIQAVLGEPDDGFARHRQQLWEMNGGSPEQWESPEAMREDAVWLIHNVCDHHIEAPFLFAHAMRPHESEPDVHLWGRPTNSRLYPLPDGLTISIHGHTPMQECPFVMPRADGTQAWFIDTGAVWTGILCAFDCETQAPTLVSLNGTASSVTAHHVPKEEEGQ